MFLKELINNHNIFMIVYSVALVVFHCPKMQKRQKRAAFLNLEHKLQDYWGDKFCSQEHIRMATNSSGSEICKLFITEHCYFYVTSLI